MRGSEVKVYGQHACRAVYVRRPDDILRVYLTEDLRDPMQAVLDFMGAERRPFKVVSAEELVALTESTHHEGVCFVVRPRAMGSINEVLKGSGPSVLVALADVSNPHNIGAILRTAAHFGARAVLLGSGRERLPPAALRTAEGGAEWVDAVPTPDLAETLEACVRAGFSVVATSSHQGRELFSERLPPRCVLLLGSEGQGLPPPLLAKANVLVRVPGTGHVESLNVAAAAAVVLGEWWRTARGSALGDRT